ncbi:MAG: asparagine--tRNA ligase [Candidatus Dasytiphilus stammeri]
MYEVSVIEILQHRIQLNSIVTVKGWVRTKRSSKSGLSFISIYDGSCLKTIQCVAEEHSLLNYREVLKLSTGCSVIVTGKLISSSGKEQDFEIAITLIKVVGWIDNPNTYPITAKHHSREYLREVCHLRPRTKFIGAMSRIRHTLAQAIHHFFHENGYLWIATPIITTYDPEGMGEMFRVSNLNLESLPLNPQGQVDFSKDFFAKATFLTGTGQLNCESYACALSKVYTFGPTFRAENSNTSRHLAEFWMVEPEVAFAKLNDIISLAEKMLKNIIQKVLIERVEDLNFFSQFDKDIITRLEQITVKNLVIIDYNDAIEILLSSDKKFQNPISWGTDLSSEHERYLAEQYFNSALGVINYPKDIKPFYMRLNDDNKTVASLDILVPGIGEIIGGSQREERLAILDQRMYEKGIKQEEYWWYRDLRRYGTVPHSGFGLGFERLIAYITGIQNIKDTVPFPRTPRNAKF